MATQTTAGASAAEREFVFSSGDFERVRKLILMHAGISLNAGKHNMVYSRLSRRLRACGMNSFSEYLDVLESDDTPERQDFINALTTNLTAFWREPHHFPVLTEHLKRRIAQGAGHVDIWCSAASTGEEPYTIAITAMQAFSSMTPPVRVLATDIDTNVLDTARRGTYSAEGVSSLDPDVLRRYFLRGSGANEGVVKVRPEVAALVTYRRLNLLDASWPMRGGFAALFCRNVMIYFDQATQYAVLRKMAPLIEPGGLLFAGHSENFSDARELLRLRGRTVYERLAGEVSARRGN
jgi:chemotaxis protein methyltransferase CheR